MNSMEHAATEAARLAVCLPITSKPPAHGSTQHCAGKEARAAAVGAPATAESLSAAVRQLCSSMGTAAPLAMPSKSAAGAYQVLVLVGVDQDDPVLNNPHAKHQLQQAVLSHKFTDVQLQFEWMQLPSGYPPRAGTAATAAPCVSPNPSRRVMPTTHGTGALAAPGVTQAAAAAAAATDSVAGGAQAQAAVEDQAAGEARPAPSRGHVCQLWSCMAEAAVQKYGCQLVVLLGDDTQVGPPGWAPAVIQAFERHPWLGCLLLTDTADPGFPSFPVLRADLHLEVFGHFLPPLFVNQGGDPYLAELYRRVGATAMAHQVTRHPISVTNAIGGVVADQAPGGYTPPRYQAQALGHDRMLSQLEGDAAVLRSAVAAAQAAAAPTTSLNSINTTSSNSSSSGGYASAVPSSWAAVECKDMADKVVGGCAKGGSCSANLSSKIGDSVDSSGTSGSNRSNDTLPERDQDNTKPHAASRYWQYRIPTAHMAPPHTSGNLLTTSSSSSGSSSGEGGTHSTSRYTGGHMHTREGSTPGPAAQGAVGCPPAAAGQLPSGAAGGRLPSVSAALGAMRSDLVTVDVLVPCYRVDTAVLGCMVQRVRAANHRSLATQDNQMEGTHADTVSSTHHLCSLTHEGTISNNNSSPSHNTSTLCSSSAAADGAPDYNRTNSSNSSDGDGSSSSSSDCSAARCPADVHLVVVVDTPAVPVKVKRWLSDQRQQLQYNMRLRYHDVNQGASVTRNRCLDESLAECVIFWDDDVMPSPGCISAYVAAFKQHPELRGFAGPTYLPRRPHQLWPSAVHMSGVSFFWTAPVTWSKDGLVPWAVTANVAFRNTTHRFNPSFPRTGGGEDIDFAIRAANAQLLAVPSAAAEHPWWRGGGRDYRRFWGWASGDGQLLEMYRPLVYRSCWACTELTVLLLVGGLLMCGALAGAAAACWLLQLLGSNVVAWGTPKGQLMGVVPWALQQVLLVGPAAAAAAAQLALQLLLRLSGCVAALQVTGLLMCVARNCLLKERLTQHPTAGRWWLRPAAAAEAYCIATFSELGRLTGHWQRHRSKGWLAAGWQVVQLMGQRFDWFCGMEPGVVVKEQRTAAAAFCVYVAVVVAVLTWQV